MEIVAAVLGCLVALTFLVTLVLALRPAWRAIAPDDDEQILRERGFRNSYFGWVISLIEGKPARSRRGSGDPPPGT